MAAENDEGFSVRLDNPSGDTQILNDTASATILNDDVPGISVTPTSGLVTKETGTTATFDVVLRSRPSADVIVHVHSQDDTEGSVDKAQLVYTSENWNVAQRVTVTGLDDATRDGNVTYTIQLTSESTDQHYSGIDPDDVEVTNQDNDKKGGGKPDKTNTKIRGPKKSPGVSNLLSAVNDSPILSEGPEQPAVVQGGDSGVEPLNDGAVLHATKDGSDDRVNEPKTKSQNYRHHEQTKQKREKAVGERWQMERQNWSNDNDILLAVRDASPVRTTIASALLRCWRAHRWPAS
jgi:hypothetical protein